MNGSAAERRPASTARGIALMLIAVVLFVVMDSTAKHLGRSYPVLEVVWARNTFHLLCLLLLLVARPRRWVGSARPGLQLFRSAVLLAATALFVRGLVGTPLAEASAIMFLAPILVTVLSAPMLGERVGLGGWIGVLGGFAGAMIIVRPGTGMVQLDALFTLGSAFCYALYMIITRVLSRTDDALTTIGYSSVVGAVLCSALMPFSWTPPDLEGWVLMVGLGVLGAFSHYLLVLAFEAAPAAIISPFDYSRLIWAAAIGFVWFGDLPDAWTIAGALIIVASGLFIMRRGRRDGTPAG